MNFYQKERIAYLRSRGESYSAISADLGVSINTIKAHCRRHNLGETCKSKISDDENLCKSCGTPLTHTPGAKKKRFCSDKCRMAWWGAHPEAVKRKAYYHFDCPVCGSEFESYGNKDRVYCSRACFATARRASGD